MLTTHDPNPLLEKERLRRLGKLYVKLIQNAREATENSDDMLQINFCIKIDGGALNSRRIDIEDAITEYCRTLPHTEHTEVQRLLTNIVYPDDANAIQHYQSALLRRASSFHNAAELIIQNSSLDTDSADKKIQAMNDMYQVFCEHAEVSSLDDSKIQAYYDAYMDALQIFLSDTFHQDKKITNEWLKNAENIINTQQKEKTHVTLSGDISVALDDKIGGKVYLQVEELLKENTYLTVGQEQEWKNAIDNYSQSPRVDKPTWFASLPEFEKQYWKEKFDQFNVDGIPFNITPVVKKAGVPGLRNLATSSFGTLDYDNDFHYPFMSMSAKSIRSSNLIAQRKEKTKNLPAEEKELTKQNIMQAVMLHQNHEMKGPDFPWKNLDSHFVLYQTLVRLKGGGDDYVIPNKNALVKEVQKDIPDLTLHTSNHCIGTPKKISKLVHVGMQIAGANTSTTKHVIDPVNDLFEQCIKNKVPEFKIYFQKSFQGTLSQNDLKEIKSNKHEKFFDTSQRASLASILSATNDYININKKPTVFLKRYQLHLAALEGLIYEDTGNCIQSSCKSGKDREGALKCYRNAMRVYRDQYGTWPPAEKGALGRSQFIQIFKVIFETHHQARLAEENASGCEGQKALQNILPKDILVEMNSELLQRHDKNATLNDMGHSKVMRDETVYQKAKASYVNKVSEADLTAIALHPPLQSAQQYAQELPQQRTVIWQQKLHAEKAKKSYDCSVQYKVSSYQNMSSLSIEEGQQIDKLMKNKNIENRHQDRITLANQLIADLVTPLLAMPGIQPKDVTVHANQLPSEYKKLLPFIHACCIEQGLKYDGPIDSVMLKRIQGFMSANATHPHGHDKVNKPFTLLAAKNNTHKPHH